VAASYAEIARRANHRCEYCRAPEELTNFRFPIDHVVPRGAAPDLLADPSNLALSCPSCNLFKADHTHGVDPSTGERVELFHPRRDRWQDHFAWSDDGLEIVGRTATGRATVALLRMNSAAQRRARAFWLTTDRFP
jgi:HNH endonuclease